METTPKKTRSRKKVQPVEQITIAEPVKVTPKKIELPFAFWEIVVGTVAVLTMITLIVVNSK